MTRESLPSSDPPPGDGLGAYITSPNGEVEPHRPARQPRSEFIRGPLPLGWFARAAQLPGQALAVALAIWFRHGIEGVVTFPLYPSTLAKFGVGRWSAYRGLAALERDSLITVERHRGRAPVVTILPALRIVEVEP